MIEFKIRCDEAKAQEIRRRAEDIGASVNFYFLASALGLINVKKFKAKGEITERQALRGQSRALKSYWSMIKRWFDKYRTQRYLDDPKGWERDFGDLWAEAEELMKAQSEEGLQKFINSGKLRTRWLEIVDRKKREPRLEARSIFERVESGELR